MIKKVKLKEEVEIYRSFLVSLHTAGWTGNNVMFKLLMDKLAAYSYSRTNSNGYEKEERQQMRRTLLALNDWHDEYKVKKEAADIKRKEEYEERLRNDPAFAASVGMWNTKKE